MPLSPGEKRLRLNGSEREERGDGSKVERMVSTVR